MKILVRIKKAPTIILLTYMDVNVPLFVHRGVSWICVCGSYSLVSVSFFYLCLHSFSFTQSHPVSPIQLITHLLMHFLSGMLELPPIFFVFPSLVWHYLVNKALTFELSDFIPLPASSFPLHLPGQVMTWEVCGCVWRKSCELLFICQPVVYSTCWNFPLLSDSGRVWRWFTVACGAGGIWKSLANMKEKQIPHIFPPVTFSAPRSKVKTIWTPGRIYPAKEPNGQLTIQSNNNASLLNGIL